MKTKEVRARLGDGADLLSVEAMQRLIAERMTPTIKRHIAESRTHSRKRSAPLEHEKAEMTDCHGTSATSSTGNSERNGMKKSVRALRISQRACARSGIG